MMKLLAITIFNFIIHHRLFHRSPSSLTSLFTAIVYEILLGNVFAEVDKREMEADSTGIAEENQDPSAWTEVKTKQNKGQ